MGVKWDSKVNGFHPLLEALDCPVFDSIVIDNPPETLDVRVFIHVFCHAIARSISHCLE